MTFFDDETSLEPTDKQKFDDGPVGQAKSAAACGDVVLQVRLVFNINNNLNYSIMTEQPDGTYRYTNDVNEILNAICRHGWRVVSASTAQYNSTNVVTGFYVFEKSAENYRSLT